MTPPIVRYALKLAILLFLGAGGCAHGRLAPSTPAVPASLQGEFVDDYANRYTIGAREWLQLPASRHHVVRMDAAGQYLIARNDSSNGTAPGKWMRIDWVALEGMPPYEWGFCYSAWQAPTKAAADSVRVARRETPRTGCNGHPFTRMRRVP